MPSRSRFRFLPAVAALALAMMLALPLGGLPEAAAQEGDGEVTLTLLHNNDGDSALLPRVNVVGTGDAAVEVPVGGIAAYKAVVERELAEARAAGNAVLNVYAGDASLSSATFVCSRMEGNPLFDAAGQRLIPYDAHIFGNHEFDTTPDFTRLFIETFGDEPFLSANLDFSEEPGFAPLLDADGLLEAPVTDGRLVGRSLIVTDETTGARFGIVGATTPALTSISSPRNVRVTADLPATAAAVQREIDRLLERGVTRVVLVAHLEMWPNYAAIAGMLRGVDVIVAGSGDVNHELLLSPDVDAALQRLPGEAAESDGAYPMPVMDADGRTVHLVTTSGQYGYVGRLDVVFDADGEVARVLMASSYPRPVVPVGEAAEAAGFAGAVAKDAAMVDAIETPLAACLDGFATTVVAASEVPLDVSSDGVRTRESNAGNLVTDAFIRAYDRHAAGFGLPERGPANPVVAVQNGGGMRQTAGDALPADGSVPGDIFLVDTLNVLAFPNGVTAVRGVSPEDMKAAFEASIGHALTGGGGFLQVSGVAVVFDAARAAGERVVSLTLEGGAAVVVNGAVADGAPAVTVVTNSFVAAGGDGYAMFAANPDKLQLPTSYERAWREYLGELETVSADDARYAPGGEGRITILNGPGDAPAPQRADAAAYTQSFVEEAISFYEANGLDAAVARYTDPESVDGQWYVFILDEEGTTIAHPTRPDFIGTSPSVRKDINGKPYGLEIVAAPEEGAWVSYVFENPDTGELQRKNTWVVRSGGLVFGSGWYEPGTTIDDPAAFTKTFVQQALDLYDAIGHEAAVSFYSSAESVHGQWYVFILDEEGTTIAHPTRPDFIGTSPSVRKDINGKPYGLEIVAAPEEGAWVSYVFENPDTGELQRKNTWVVRSGGLVFGSGWYEPGTTIDDPAAFTKTFVQQALDLYDAIGREAAIAFYNTPASIHGQWYVFISDEDDVTLAHATVPANVGRNADDIVGPNAFPAGRLVADGATEDGAWVRYTYLNPATGESESKHSWVVRYDGLLFGSGWYEPGPARDDPPAYTRAFVEQAVHLYEVVGRERTVAYYNMPESVDGPWYVFILDEDDVTIAHPVLPENVGMRQDDVLGPNGYPTGRLVADAGTEEGRWVRYTYLNPDSGALEAKQAWVVRRDGLLFGSGWYQPAPAKDDPAAYARALVDQATHLHEILGRERAVAYYNSPESVDGPWYVFIADGDGAILAAPTQPQLIGADMAGLTDVNGKAFGREIMAVDENGAWVDYVFENPDTGELERKNSWVVRSGGLVFGSGWYEPASAAEDEPEAPPVGTGLAPDSARSLPAIAPLLLALALALAGLAVWRRKARRRI